MQRRSVVLLCSFSLVGCGVEETARDLPFEVEALDETFEDDEEEVEEDEPEAPEVDHSDALDAYILGLGYLDLPPVAGKHEIVCDPMQMECPEPWAAGNLTCALQWYEQTQHLDTFIALAPDSPALWPGAIIRGGEVMDGFLSPIGLERAPATFSLSLEALSASPVATMEVPSLSAFREARNEILKGGLDGATPAQMSYEISRVHSRAELSIHVGVSLDWAGVLDFDAMFDFDDGEFGYRYLLDFKQTYYTADLDTPPRPSDMFGRRVSVADLEPHTSPGNPPVYVQSVAYGRRILFGIESDASLSEMVTAMDAALGGIAKLEANVGAKETLETSKITAALLGGDGGAAVQTIVSIDMLMDFITQGGNYSPDSPGAPIAYRLSYLDNATARVALTAQYSKEVCQ